MQIDRICLQEARSFVDKKYVGFVPNGSSVKPVHIASGSLRCIYGEYNRNKNIKRMALVSDAKGNIPLGNDAHSVFEWLAKDEKLEDNITENSMESMRNIMQRLLSVDKGVYVVKDLRDSMISYSAGSKYFLTSKVMYEDAGEFIGSIIKGFCPELSQYIKALLDKSNDPISMLFEPVLAADMEIFTSQNQYEDIPAFQFVNEHTQWFIDGVKASGECLLDNLSRHSNPLAQLRIFNFFCIFMLIRYMTLLEAFYCKERIRPILLDFSGESPSFSSVARASEMSYTQIYKSLNRFYAWGYALWLKEKGFSKEELLQSQTPVYEAVNKKKIKKSSKVELDTLWRLAKERSASLNGEEVYLAFGETMYDMLALEASSHPVTYLRTLGNLSGILYPPDKLHPNKRFVVSQDILEMLLRCCVKSEEIISGMDIRQRLWDRFGIIIGGSQFEMNTLLESGMILQIDEDALEENFAKFAAVLKSMDFAEVMADGILQISLGGC